MRARDEIAVWLRAEGWTYVRRTGSGHTQWRHPHAAALLIVPWSGGRRSNMHTMRTARRLLGADHK